MVNEHQCDLCHSSEYTVVHDLRGSRYINGPVVRCNFCGLVYRLVSLSREELSAYYEREEYGDQTYLKEHQGEYKKNIPRSEIGVYARVLTLLERHKPTKGKLLDGGCARGILLDMARKQGWDVLGIEVSPFLAESARNNFGLDVLTSTIEEAVLPENTFDAAILWDVIEHPLSPAAMIRKMNSLIKPGGTLVIFTQNNNSLMVRLGELMGRIGISTFLYHLYDNYHLFFFTEKTLRKCLGDSGFQVLESRFFPADISKRSMDISRLQGIIFFGIRFVNAIAALVRKHYRMAIIAQKKQGQY